MARQGGPAADVGQCELDHHVPLVLGGHPRNPKNLVLQPLEGERGAKNEDCLERRLQDLACAGRLMLDEARATIYFDWVTAYRRFVVP